MPRQNKLLFIILPVLFVWGCAREESVSAGEQTPAKTTKVMHKSLKEEIKGVASGGIEEIKTAVPGSIEEIKTVAPGSIVIDGDISDWQEAGIDPLEGLEWKNVYDMPMFKDTGRIKSVRLAYDAENLLLMLEIEPGVKQRFDERQSSGHIGYLYLDSDGTSSTGARRHIKDEYPGWDYRIYLPEGFITKENASPEEAKPAAWYQIERIKSYAQEEVEYGTTFSCEYEEVPGGNQASYNKPANIAFQGDFIEMNFPFELLKIEIPTEIRLVIEDFKALPNAETQIFGYLKGTQTKLPSEFSISYYFSAELIYKKIEISQLQFSYTYFEDRDGKCETWFRQEPCWGAEDLRTRKAILSEGEANGLLSLIKQTGFMKLETTYGGAGEHQRYYPHKISVKIGEDEKRVSYQSFPGASAMPEAFKKVKDKLFELVRKKFNPI